MKAIYYYENREFEVYGRRYGEMMFEATVYEVVRPTWKIFRTKFSPFIDTWFCIDNYPSIDDGIKTLIAKQLLEDKLEEERTKKVNDFFKNTY